LIGGVEVACLFEGTFTGVGGGGVSSTVVVASLVETVVSIVVVASFVGVTCGVLDASGSVVVADVADGEASITTGVVVASLVIGMEEDASTCADASRISKMLANARAKRTSRPIPPTATMFVFIFARYLQMLIIISVLFDLHLLLELE
jgi:hypothetical protein